MALLPQALPLAIPIGLAFAVAVGLSGRATMNVAKAMTLAMAAASLLSFATLVWGLPAGNQAFRTLVAEVARSNGELVPSNSQKGPNEMTLAELSRDISSFAASGRHQLARRYLWTFHLRFALAVAVLAVAVLLLAVPVNHRLFRGLIAFATCFSYWALLYIGEFAIQRDYLAPFAGAWLPNMVLAAAAIVALSYSTRRDVSAVASHS
jgi:lipopolysaccharide export LptBFGC system permease protein LptF